MFKWKYLMGILFAFSLVATVPNAPAKAVDAGDVAAGIAGAIIMNQLMQGARPRAATRPYTSKRRAARSKSKSSGEAAYAKDPFAGESAPAGYAKPVTDSK